MKTKIFVARETQYSKIGFFPLNSYVYYLTHDFIAPARAFNLLTLALISQLVLLILQLVLLVF